MDRLHVFRGWLCCLLADTRPASRSDSVDSESLLYQQNSQQRQQVQILRGARECEEFAENRTDGPSQETVTAPRASDCKWSWFVILTASTSFRSLLNQI